MRAACIFIPRFPLAVELASGCASRGQAVIIGEAADGCRAVLDCSPEAEAQGVRPGMPVREALGLCRDAVFLPPDPIRYHEASEAFLRVLSGVSPLVEGGDLGLAYVGVDGRQGHYEDEMALGETLVRAVRSVGLEASSAGLVRHRLNRGGNRRLNAVLYRIVLTQAHHLPAAKAYIERRVSEGKTRREAHRALRRFVIRAIWRLWQECRPAQTTVSTERAA